MAKLLLYRGDYHYYLDKIAEEKDKATLAAIEAEKEAKAAEKRTKQKEKEKAKKAQTKA